MKILKALLMCVVMFLSLWGLSFAQTSATLTLPSISGASGAVVPVPVQVTTDSSIGLAQFVVEYNSTILHFENAQVGSGVSGFAVSLVNADLPFSPTTSGTDDNVLVQVSGGGSASFTGTDVEVAVLNFTVIGSSGDSPLAFDQGTNKTFLTTTRLNDINNGAISFVDGAFHVEVPAQISTTLTLPSISGASGAVVPVPVQVTTDSSIGLAQFVVEYNSTILRFENAQVGSGVSGFSVSLVNADLPFLPTTSGTDDNVLVQVSGGGMASFTGTDVEVAVLNFTVIGSSGDSPLAFDQGTDRTFLTTTHLNDINDGAITFIDGTFHVQVQALATLMLPLDAAGPPGGTIPSPVTVSTDSAIGLAQFVVEFDSSVIKFATAEVGADAAGFTVSIVNTQLPFAPTAAGTNENVLVQISGGGTNSFAGTDKEVAILNFTVAGTAGDTSPLVFDRESSRTFLTTTTLNDISGSNITFIDGAFQVLSLMIVTNTNDSGPGSLRDAILQANNNPGPDTIRFAIPKTDPRFDADVGVWTIMPDSELPIITGEGLVIDGFSQAEFIGEDTNPDGPEIQLSGSNAGDYARGLRIFVSGVELYGLTINHFPGPGIWVNGVVGGRISGCYIGTNFAGSDPAGNSNGIWLSEVTGFNIVPVDTLPNVISGNTFTGIGIIDTSSHIFVWGNIIGLDRTSSYAIGNGSIGNYGGIFISESSDSNEVAENRIGGNSAFGVYIIESNGNTVGQNWIGTNEDLIDVVGNEYDGVYITNGAQDNLIIENLIGMNGRYGVYVTGSQTIRNKITRNSISFNGGSGINNDSGGNGELAPPIITSVATTTVTGTAPPNATVEIFSDPTDEGSIYEGTVTSDASGNFTWTGTPTGPNVTATATDVAGNTSEFSTPVSTGVEDQTQAKIPQVFKLFQNYPNPFNPQTRIDFALPKSCQVTITIYNMLGQEIKILVDKTLQAGHYVVLWDGKDAYGKQISGGIYFVRMRAGSFSALRKAVFLK